MSRVLSGILGFACACPLLLVTGINFRLIDLANLASACVVAGTMALHGRLTRLAYLYGFLVLLTLGWVWAEFSSAAYLPTERSATMILVRWVLAIPTAYLISNISQSNARHSLFTGILSGIVTIFLLLLYDYWTFEVTGRPAFEHDPSDIFFSYSEFRASGIMGHPNEAAIACCLALPVVIGMIDELRFPAWAAVPVALMVAAVFMVTETRSALIASLILLGCWLAITRPSVLYISITIIATMALLLHLSASAPDASSGTLAMIVRRFTDLSAAEDNAEGRLGTVLGSFGLIASHPFGMGSAYVPALNALTGLNATHNGFLQLALLGGLPIALFVLAGLLKVGCGVFWSGRRVESWMAAYIVVVSLFEEIYFLPTIPIFVIWLLGCLCDPDVSLENSLPTAHPGRRHGSGRARPEQPARREE